MIIYFVPWVVFLVLVIVSVPIASMLEKRKHRAAFADQFDDDDDEYGAEEAYEEGEAEVVAEEGEAEVVFEDAGGFGGEGSEDLSAFDDFK